MKAVVIRFDAPLVSFGAPSVDQNSVVQRFPSLSMLVGLVGNALGWTHRDHGRLDRLQKRLRFAARTDREGTPLIDYQTVDLGTDWMRPAKAGWTTKGRISERGGASAEGTHQRYRHYRADSVHTVVLTLAGDDPPSIDDIAEAFMRPARPLFIGRKACLPAAPMFEGVMESEGLVAALAAVPRARRGDSGPLAACWGDGEEAAAATGISRCVAVTDERDWRTKIHVGRRFVREGLVDPPEARR